MWLWVLFAVAVFHEAVTLHDKQYVNNDQAPISNIELLVPLAVPLDPTERNDRGREARHDHGANNARIQQDEPFSAIPAYAFTLDTGEAVAPQFRTRHKSPKTELLQSHSLYVAQLWPRNDESEERDNIKREGQNACRNLARQYAGSAREVLLYLCSELVDVLAARCDCCDDRALTKSRTNNSPLPAMPWIESNARREFPNFGQNSKWFQQYMRLPKERIY